MDEVIERANRLPVGLAAYAFTSSNKRAMELSEHLEAGMVGINSFNIAAPEAPFGGVKDSGVGREAGSEGLIEHFHAKLVSLTDG
jgi:succinate-semialdehyde dehydrogenase/glutarate-semialdehyde dehydrogenase